MSLVKQDLVKTLVDEIGLRQKEASQFVNDFFEQINVALIETGKVKISGFGNWVLRQKSERLGRNPKTGKEHIILARTVVSFKPGVKFKRLVQAQGVAQQK